MAGRSKSKKEKKENVERALTEEQIAEYRDAFSVFDKNGDGEISLVELRSVLKTLGKDPTDEEVQTMIDSVDVNHNGTVEFDEFLDLMEKEVKAFESEAMIREAFGVFDQDGDGYITIRKLKQVIQDLGCQFSEEEIDEMMELADQDGDGRVEYEGLIGLLSMQNETLFSAYQKRVRIEEKERKEMAHRIPVEEEPEEPEPERVPDMNEIASQYEPEVYEQFSRKVVGGRAIVKKPGKKVEMSRTRLKYLQRKNVALQTDMETPVVEGTVVSPSLYTSRTSPVKPSASPMTEIWVGTIHDERQRFDTRFVSKPPKQYKHVGSRLKDPNYYLRKQDRKPPEPEYVETSLTPRIDIDKEIKDLQFHSKQKIPPVTSLKTVDSVRNEMGGINGVEKRKRYVPHDNYSLAYKKDRQSVEKMYYAMWRTAFTNALEKLRENKRGKILLKTPDLIAEHARMAQVKKKKAPEPLKPVKRLSVISPSIEHAIKSFSNDNTPRSVVLDQGSYTQRFRKLAGLDHSPSVQPSVHEELPPGKPLKTVARRQPTHLTERRGDIITKSGLNRMLNIRT